MSRTANKEVRAFRRLVFNHLNHVKNQFAEGINPLPGSPGADEVEAVRWLDSAEEWERHLVTAVNIAALMLAVSGDHLACFAKVLDPPMPLYSFAVPARAAAETAATGYWLLDPAITAQERVARGFALRRKSTDEYARTVVLMMPGVDERPRVAAIEGQAAALGISIPDIPRPTMLVGEVLRRHTTVETAGRGIYRHLSGVAHGTIYAAVQRMRDVGPGSTEFHRRMEPDLTLPAVHSAVIVAIGAHASLVDRALTYCGMDRWAWDRWQQKLLVDLRPSTSPPAVPIADEAPDH